LLLEGRGIFSWREQKEGRWEECYDADWVGKLINCMILCMRVRLDKLVRESAVDKSGILQITRSLDGEFYFDILYFMDEMVSAS
jgi:hypothetical protein